MDNDLTERYNEGVVAAPELAGEPVILQRPAWQPTREQLAAARTRLILVIGILVALMVVGWLVSLGWGA